MILHEVCIAYFFFYAHLKNTTNIKNPDVSTAHQYWTDSEEHYKRSFCDTENNPQ